MSDIERILLECRYFLTLDKSYLDIANHLNIEEKVVYDDLNYKLLKVDRILYNQVSKKMKSLHN